MRNIEEVFERYNFNVEKEEQGYYISQYTPAGEDWGFTLDKLEDIKDYAENFDPDEEFFERYNFNVEKEEQGYYISQYTPAGEDWGFTLDKLEDIKDYAENFDPDEEFDMWIEARHRVSGVPSPHDLWEDQIWKQNMLKNVANEV